MDHLLTRRGAILFVGILALWRLYLSSQLQLHPDEAYYWLWSHRLDLSYFDHPPMVAYFIWLTTRFSETELWVRLSGWAPRSPGCPAFRSRTRPHLHIIR